MADNLKTRDDGVSKNVSVMGKKWKYQGPGLAMIATPNSVYEGGSDMKANQFDYSGI